MAVDQIKPKNTNIHAVLSGPPPGFPLKVKERTQVGFRGKNGRKAGARHIYDMLKLAHGYKMMQV